MMKNKLCTFALVLGLSPLAMLAPAASAQDRDHDRDDRQQGTWTRNNDLQNALHQRVPNSNIAVNWQNNNTVVLTGTAASDRDRQYADQLVRSQVGNARVIDQVTVNGYNSAYRNGTYSNGYPNNGTYSNGDRDRDNRTDADRDRNRTDNDRDDRVRRNDNDRDDQARRNDADDHRQMSDNDRDHDKKHKDKDKKNKDKDKKDKDDRGDHDSDNRPH
jgi:hypothetical protein